MHADEVPLEVRLLDGPVGAAGALEGFFLVVYGHVFLEVVLGVTAAKRPAAHGAVHLPVLGWVVGGLGAVLVAGGGHVKGTIGCVRRGRMGVGGKEWRFFVRRPGDSPSRCPVAPVEFGRLQNTQKGLCVSLGRTHSVY